MQLREMRENWHTQMVASESLVTQSIPIKSLSLSLPISQNPIFVSYTIDKFQTIVKYVWIEMYYQSGR